MPTGPKLVAALIFGFVAFFASGLIVPYLPQGTQLGLFHPVATGLGALMGWAMSGRHAGEGISHALGYGLTTVALTVFWGLVVFATDEMIDRSIHLRYDGPVQAVREMVRLMLDFAVIMAKPDVLIWLLAGALVGGVLTEMSWRKWT